MVNMMKLMWMLFRFVAKNYMLLAELDAKNKDVVKNDPKKLLENFNRNLLLSISNEIK